MRTLHSLCLLILFSGLLLPGCSPTEPATVSPLFTAIPAEQTGISFQNRIDEHEGFNVLEYEYFYNGGGVAVGDINGDRLPDVYFVANMGPDRLYLNKGDFTFEDITQQAGLTQEPSWKTGVTMADVNSDGWLDIYVARSGQVGVDRRRNLLYINNGDLTFTEQAAAFGLDSPSYSNHASFFDYDLDGDLDMFLLNHPIRRYSYFVVEYLKNQRDSLAGDKLYRNDEGFFTDVSEEAGIIGNPLGFGLSATVSDINQDGWPDLYVANDYIEEDYLYINQGDGTFSEEIRDWITVASYSSMGSDIADMNNDGLVDIVTLDMMADNHLRQKILKGPEDFLYYDQMRSTGYHDQAMRNMLHLRDGTQSFREIGRLAGVAMTDWSWAPLMADFDNDGWKDLFVTNGYLRDYTNLDFLENILAQAREASAMGESFSSLDMVRQMPSTPLPNYMYRNEGSLRFEDVSSTWALDTPSFSNGAAYGDLDLDGDLDLVVNNINASPFVYRNEAQQNDHYYLRVLLEGPDSNPFGTGASVVVTSGETTFYQEAFTARGYLSSVSTEMLFGLGSREEVDVAVRWPDGTSQRLAAVAANQAITLRYDDAQQERPSPTEPVVPLFASEPAGPQLPYVHREDAYNDFEREPLLPYMLSRLGPALARADVNRDGLEDIYLGGARDIAGVLYLQQLDGSFLEASVTDFVSHSSYEDVDALFLDADTDGDLDLYVASGGNDVVGDMDVYQDRLYVNNGFGRFDHAPSALPPMPASTGAVAAHDFDGDGDNDLFVGGRSVPGAYGIAPRSFLLENKEGTFEDITETNASELLYPGMITDAAWADINNDGQTELMLAGHWMPVSLFRYGQDGSFTSLEGGAALDSARGWWNTIHLVDLDGDGDQDLIAGNNGRNSSLAPSAEHPVSLHVSDVDANGITDPIIFHSLRGIHHTIYWRNELIQQIPRWASFFPSQETYARASADDIFPLIPPDAREWTVTDFGTYVFENDGTGRFTAINLPVEVQFSPVQAILTEDFNNDGRLDILLGGNNFATRAQWGRDHASNGLLLVQSANLHFDLLPEEKTGITLNGDVRHLMYGMHAGRARLFAIYNDAPVDMYRYLNPPF